MIASIVPFILGPNRIHEPEEATVAHVEVMLHEVEAAVGASTSQLFTIIEL
jgi:hypothetical protein